MKNILIGVLLALGIMFGIKVTASYIQDLAWQQKISDGEAGGIYRVEWYGDVCYLARPYYGNAAVAMSCIRE